MKVMGLDPGISATGYGIIDGKKTIFGTIRPKEKDYYKKIIYICDRIKAIIERYKPDTVSLERAFYQKNVSSLIKISELRGAIIFLLLQKKIDFIEFTPTQIKLATTGNGQASKSQVRFIIERIVLKNKARISNHAIDALAIAYTGLRKLT
jgi:crossover junction endodeoxyribonuclease RuvC|uniref:Crossover junction endodeoxyribonuclease RuvC n=1 Tax=candidate division WOR-3 bacterium TaxID=2052148 RepID=A0A7V3RGS0_UNCW3